MLCCVQSKTCSHRALQLRAHLCVGLIRANSTIWSHFFVTFDSSSLFAGGKKIDRIQASVCSADGRTTSRAKKVARNKFDRISRAAKAVDPILVATRAKVMTRVEWGVRNDLRVFWGCV
jgi:hypothetical protein